MFQIQKPAWKPTTRKIEKDGKKVRQNVSEPGHQATVLFQHHKNIWLANALLQGDD